MSWSFRLQGRLTHCKFLRHFRPFSKQGSTHYETLGLSQNASIKEIKDSYIELSKVHHPDSPKGSSEKFRIISEAYEVLSNESSKKTYDETLPQPRRSDVFRGGKTPEAAPKHRSIRVDLSRPRMEKAWDLYRDRWSREEDRWIELEKMKKEFRQDLDEIRANMHNMSPEEKELFLESLRQFRRPEYYEQFRQSTTSSFKDPPSSHPKSNNPYTTFKDELRNKAGEIRERAEKVKSIYETSEFLGENYAAEKGQKSIKYDIDQKGEVFRISQRTIQIIFGVFFCFFIIDMTYKNNVRKTNRFFLMEEEKRSKGDA